LTNNVARLIVNAALIGNYADKKGLALLRTEQAATARKAKQTSDAGKRKNLDSAIAAEARNRVMAISIEFAALIRPDICNRLGVEQADGWPQAPTIKAAISRFKKIPSPKK
jgi:hypothetical protein